MGYTTDLGGQGAAARVVYRGPDRHLHELSLVSGGNWSDADVTAIAGGPDVTTALMGYTTTDLGGHGPAARVVYRGPDAHVHELSLVSGGNWSHTDLTAIAGGPEVTASPMGYTTTDLGGHGPAARVVYRGPDRHLHELSLVSGGNWSHTDLTAIAGGPGVTASPMGYTTGLAGQGPAARVVYVGLDNHVHELSLVSGGNWSHTDITAIAGGPDAPFFPIMGYTTNLSSQGRAARVLYVDHTPDLGHLHELSLVSGGNWSHTDITAIAGGSAPFGAAMGYATDLGGQGPAARVLYASEDKHIHELSMVG
jgi:hypothetical protein